MEDYDIIELYWARDQEAIRQTDRKYGGFCRSILRRLLGGRTGRGGVPQRHLAGGLERHAAPAAAASAALPGPYRPEYRPGPLGLQHR